MRAALAIAAAVVISLVGASGFWLFAKLQADAQFAALEQPAADRPYTLACGSRAVSGFPLAIDVACRDPVVTVRTDAGPLALRFAALATHLALTSPGRLVIAPAGPLAIEGASAGTATWSSMRIEAAGGAPSPDEIALDATDLSFECASCSVGIGETRAKAAAIHLTRKPEGDGRAYRVTGRADGARSGLLDGLTGNDEPATLSIDGEATRVAAPDLPDLSAAVDRWRAEGGEVSLSMAALDKGPMHLGLAGAFTLDQARRPAGRFQIEARNAASLFSLFTARLSPLLRLAIGAALNGVDQAGDPATAPMVRLPGAIRDGAVSVGPLRDVLRIGPLY